MGGIMDDDEEIGKMTAAEMEASFMETMKDLSPEDQQAFAQLVHWVAYEKPKDFEFTSKDQMEKMLIDIKRKNARRRLGVRFGTILPFRKSKETK
jgi:predicted DNA-binding ribbon-helix-helix protein